jgi:hypothetical protein
MGIAGWVGFAKSGQGDQHRDGRTACDRFLRHRGGRSSRQPRRRRRPTGKVRKERQDEDEEDLLQLHKSRTVTWALSSVYVQRRNREKNFFLDPCGSSPSIHRRRCCSRGSLLAGQHPAATMQTGMKVVITQIFTWSLTYKAEAKLVAHRDDDAGGVLRDPQCCRSAV